MIWLKINILKKNIISHDLRNVYFDLFFRLVFSFYLFTLITVKVDSNEFSMYAFGVLVSTLIVQIINGSTENLINKNLILNKNYLNYFFYKIIVFFLTILPFLIYFKNNQYLFFCFILSFLSLTLEHLDIKLRYNYNYGVYIYRVFLQLFFIFFKVNSAKKGIIVEFLYYSILEALIMVFVSSNFVFNLKKGENDKFLFFFKSEKKTIYKYTISSLLIFLFFKFDQFFVYFKGNSHFFSSYFVASRFNEILNGLVAIWARYSIPKLFKENSIGIFRNVLISNFFIHFIFSLSVCFIVFLYVVYLNPKYSNVVEIYLILSLSGFFLVFGQVRGVYFIKNNYFLPDIINTIIGIVSFILSVLILGYFFESYCIIPISYLLGFMVSGFLTTFMYELGRKFILKLIDRKKTYV